MYCMLYCTFSNLVLFLFACCYKTRAENAYFASFFLGFRRPNLITGLRSRRTPDYPLRSLEPVPDRRTGALPSLW